MQPIEFPQQNVVYAKDQPEYKPLPAYIEHNEPEKSTYSCWQLSAKELEHVQKTGEIWLAQMTFGQPLQPVLLMAKSPFNQPVTEELPEPKKLIKAFGTIAEDYATSSFCVITFDPTQPMFKIINYLSNLSRENVTKVLKEVIKRIEANQDFPMESKN